MRWAHDLNPQATLVENCLARQDELVDRMVRRARSEIPFYPPIPEAELRSSFAEDMARGLNAVRERRAASSAELAQSAAVGELRAREGVPVEALLRAWRIGLDEVWREAQAIVRRRGLPHRVAIEMMQTLWVWADAAMVMQARAHRQAELELARQDQDARATFVHGVLRGALDAVECRLLAERHGLDPDAEYHAVRARLAADVTARQVELALDLERGSAEKRGIVASLEGDVAGIVIEPPPKRLPATAGVGPPRSLGDQVDSFASASRALSTSLMFGLAGAWTVPELGAKTAVATDPELGEALERRYVRPFLERGAPGQGVLDAVRAFLGGGGSSIERLARGMHVHPNTLRYRLRRFEEITGAELRNPECLIEVWWAFARADLASRERDPSQADTPAVAE